MQDDELLAEVVDRPRHAYVLLPDMRVIERPGWFQLITPSFTEGGFNDVHAELDEADADRVIAETIAEYRHLGVKFRWTVGPDSKPADLADRLARAGLRRTDSVGMARATDIAPTSPVAVVRVDATTLDQFTETMSDGWRRDATPFRVAHRAMLASDNQHMFLAICDGDCAGAATYVSFPRSAYLLGAVVREAFRGRGVYRALVEARLADAAARGITLATTHAMNDTSAPMLAGFGFRTVCELVSFRS
ncbi:MAG TPA: GNAT family N-acetyltransferase [Kofleriaceae bacterium]|nr:GNAT family N-acetyltransferase [Kofleriaceae bacterium]